MRPLLDGPRGTTLFDVLNRELLDAVVHARPLSLAFLDIDDLTGFNERCGWEAGTALLNRVAESLAALGPEVSSGSFGGDEFAIVLPRTGSRVGQTRMRRALARIRSLAKANGHACDSVFGSVGGTTSTTTSTPAGLIRVAHSALMAAKASGGNRVRWASADTETLV